jgi:hypothetical protein
MRNFRGHTQRNGKMLVTVLTGTRVGPKRIYRCLPVLTTRSIKNDFKIWLRYMDGQKCMDFHLLQC